MQCKKCKIGKLEVKQTYTIGEGHRIQRAKCNSCGKVVALQTITLVLDEAPKKGNGARAIAKARSGNASAAGATITDSSS